MRKCHYCFKEGVEESFCKGAHGLRTHKCKKCAAQHLQNWRKDNPEKHRAIKQRSYWKDPEKARARSRQAYRKNPAYAKNYAKNWGVAHPGKHNQYRLNYFRRFPEKRRAVENHRIHRKRSNRNYQTVSHKHWVEIKARYNHRCAYCGSYSKLTQDHVIPLSKGGAHAPENIVPACRSCNGKKQDKAWIPKVFPDEIFV